MITISIKSRKYNCVIDLYQKVTVVRGKSGTGKTTFTNAVVDDSKAYAVTVSDSSYTLSVLGKDWYSVIDYNIEHGYKCIYVLDDCDFMFSKEFSHLFTRDTLSYYIIINRFEKLNIKSLSRVPFSVDEVYDFVADGKEHYIEKFYTYKGVDVRRIKFDLIITEDSSSGFEFLKELSSVEVETTKGKDKVLSYFEKNLNNLIGKNIVLFVDLAAFGNAYQLLYEFIKINKLAVTIFTKYYSFEYMLLKSNMFKFDFDMLNNEDIVRHISYEALCESIMTTLTDGKLYAYGKKQINDCYIKDCCCKEQSKNMICDKGLEGDKFEALFKGTEFENILTLRY